MTRLLAVALAAAALTGGARAATFSVQPASLPGSDLPNAPGAIALSPFWTSPPARQLSLSAEQLLALWQDAGSAYGIPWQVLAAIDKIESNFGRNMGPSSAGAIGWMQFMPDTWLRWGVDADGDGYADPWNAYDAVYAAARYLAATGGRTDLRRAIFSYNHADWYVSQVLDLAQAYGLSGEGGGVVFELDRLGAGLEETSRTLAEANAAYGPAVEEADRLRSRVESLERQASQASLLSDQLLLQRRTVQLSVEADAAQARVDDLRSQIEQSQTQLQALRQQASAASFTPAATLALGGPASAGDYVFPVGGGPEVVSVSHTHHDYPAADIAAPEGSPVYALADAVVLYAWNQPDPRCGFGFTLQASDGREWTYCHLSYLEPAVQQGTVLRAGTPVGLVGATGEATGPHLHLQLQPADSYPQSEGWFQSFAGTAFGWSDAAPGPVFAVVSQ